MCCRAKTNNRKSRSGKTWDIDEKSISSKPVCAGTYSTSNMVVKKVVFDASFKGFRPTTTGYFSQQLPTAIGRVVFDDNNATQIYNRQGKRVNANLRHLPAGFYIVNGKKVYLNEKP